MILSVRKYRPAPQLILLFLSWMWVIVMSFIEKDNQLSINIIEPFSTLTLSIFPIHTIGNIILVLLVLLFEAVYLSYIFQKHSLIERNNWIPSILYLIMVGVSGSYTLSPPIISNLFILLSLDRLFVSYDSTKGIDDIMLSGLYISIAALFYFTSAIFILGIWLGLLIFRNLNWRYFAASIIGLLTPLIYLATWFFIEDQLLTEANLFDSVIKQVFMQIKQDLTGSMIVLSITMLLLVISTFYLSVRQQGKLVKIRKKTSIIITLSIISAITVFISHEPIKQSMVVFVLLLTGALSIQISEMKSNLLSAMLFWFLIIFYAISNIGIF